MPEGMNVEIAHKLAEVEERPETDARLEWLELAEAIALAIVAVATAWSGYCSARWDGRQAELYENSTRLRVDAAATREDGMQKAMFDGLSLNAWYDAMHRQDEKLAQFQERRFTPYFHKAFQDWLKTDPLTNPDAPAGPFLMPSYANPQLIAADKMKEDAADAFAEGTEARETGERYVRVTVVLATVLFLIAIAQRFKIRKVRLGLFFLGSILLVYSLGYMALLPQA